MVVYVHQFLTSNSNFKISYYYKFHLSFEKNYFYPKITNEMNREIFDCLKREQDFCVKTIIPNLRVYSRVNALSCL